MLRKKERTAGMMRSVSALAFGLMLAAALWCQSTVLGHAQGTATVVAASGKIRKEASTSSETLASVKKDDSLDVTAQTSDSDGYTWYKVFVNSTTQGYVRADVVTVSGTIPEETASASTTEQTASSGGNVTTVGGGSTTTASTTEDTTASTAAAEQTTTETAATVAAANESDVLAAQVKEQVNVRAGAGTGFSKVGSAPANTVVTVTGEDVADDGTLWYQVSYVVDNKEVTGFIREDFLEVTETRQDEATGEETGDADLETPVIDDYTLTYAANADGEMDWYLNDNIQGTSQSLTQMLDVMNKVENGEYTEGGTLTTTVKMLIAVMAIVIFALIVAVTLLAFKVRDTYVEYEDEDEEEEEDDIRTAEASAEEEVEEDEEEEEEPVARKPRVPFFRKARKEEPEEDEDDEYEEEEAEVEAAAAETKTPEPEQPKSRFRTTSEPNRSWQAKDFLEPDDDMEFEFLDL
jgi:hypothetical protein